MATDTGKPTDQTDEPEAAAKLAEGPVKAAEASKASEPEAAAAPIAADPNFARISHPAGATSCSFGGMTYEADAKGVLTVPLAAVSALTAHGFVLTK